MAADTPQDFTRLALAAKERRLALGFSRTDAAAAAEISKNTYQRIEAGHPVRDVSYARVETVLRWAPGSCQALLNGEDPKPVAAQAEQPVTFTRIPAEDLGQALTSAIVATSDTLTAAEIREISRRALEELQRRDLL